MVTLGIVCYWIYHIRGLQWEHIWGFGIYHGVLEEFFMRFFVEFYGPANCWSRGLAMKALVKGRRWQSALKLFEEAMQRRSSLEISSCVGNVLHKCGKANFRTIPNRGLLVWDDAKWSPNTSKYLVIVGMLYCGCIWLMKPYCWLIHPNTGIVYCCGFTTWMEKFVGKNTWDGMGFLILGQRQWKIEKLWWLEQKTHTHRIHGAAIYGNIYHQYTPVMIAYIPAPWILWDK